MARSALRRTPAHEPAESQPSAAQAEPAARIDPKSASPASGRDKRPKRAAAKTGKAAAKGATPAPKAAPAASRSSAKPPAGKASTAKSSGAGTAAVKPATSKAAAPKSAGVKSAGVTSAPAKRPPHETRASSAKPSRTKSALGPSGGPKRAASKTASAAKPASAAKAPKTALNGPSGSHERAEARVSEARPAPKPEPAAASKPEADASGAQNPFLTPDVELFAANMARLWEQGGKAMSAYMRPREGALKPADASEIVDIAKTLGQVVERFMADPARVAEAQRDFAGGFLDLWAGTMKRLSGETVEPTVTADPKDPRFRDPEWSEHPVFSFLKQAYLHTSRWADRMVEQSEDLDPHVRHKATFYVKLLSNAASPSNFLPTNPELIRETLASKGENLVRGMRMLAEDIDAGGGDLRIRQTDRSNFEVGRNLATTPGKVIYRNALFELIQYAPATEMARTRPLVIVPPWINKFYVLDLTPEKSMIRWAVGQGLTVFCISWVNPDERHAAMSFDDYMRDGVMRAVDVAREITGSGEVDTAGYCVGGTLLAVTLAYMAAKDDRRIASATLMTTQVDFTHAGDLKVFVDEEQIAAVEAKMAQSGYLDGAKMANAFNMIRSNDMIFPYLVNNYLKGKAPFPFDLLYWNSDATRMPAANHSFYLRGCYLNNDLARGRMEIAGEILDLAKITAPVYQLAAKEDHIAPAKSVFLGAQLFGGPVRFVLAGSGHIAGVVNPPAKMKYQYWSGGDAKGELKHWLDHAEEKPGSWWPDWRAWLAGQDATMVAARIPGEGPYPALEDAPGGYVKAKA